MPTAELAALIRRVRPQADVAPLGLHNALADTSPVAADGTPVRLYGRYAIVGPTSAPGGARPRRAAAGQHCAAAVLQEPGVARRRPRAGAAGQRAHAAFPCGDRWDGVAPRPGGVCSAGHV